MALYFKCSKCGYRFIDYCGEYAAYDTEECFMNGPYLCPECNSEAESISSKIFYKKENDTDN